MVAKLAANVLGRYPRPPSRKDIVTDPLPSHLFYVTRLRRPLVDRAEGIYLWTKDGRRFIDGSSGPVAVNLGYGNAHVLEAMRRQMEKTTFAYRLHFENEPAEDLARDIAGRMPGGLDRIFFVSGGSEAVEACIKLARQWAVATGQPGRWKVIGRMPSYHGGTLGALAVTGDAVLTGPFEAQMRPMPTVPAPTAYRDRDNLSLEERGIKYADMLEERLLAEGPESVVAFIMEPIGGAATNALVAPDSYYARIREICDRYGILLIHDEVMSGVARTGRFLGGDHWKCRPDLVSLSKGIGSGYMPLGAMCAPQRIVKPVLDSGGFAHGHTYAGNPLACAAGLAVMQEVDRLQLAANAAARGEDLIEGLKSLQRRFPFIGDVRGKGLMTAIEFVADPATMELLKPEINIGQRVLDLAYERGLIVYFRRVRGGVQGDCVMVAPPLIVTREQIDEIVSVLGDAIAVAAREFGLPVNA